MSTWYSGTSSTMRRGPGPSRSKDLEGYLLSSFSLKGLMCEVWKVGKMLGLRERLGCRG